MAIQPPKREVSVKEMIITSMVWWLMWVVLGTYVLHRAGVEYSVAFTDSFISTLLLVLISMAMLNSMRYYRPANENYFYLRLWALLLSIGATWLQNHLLNLIYAEHSDYRTLLNNSVPVRFCFNLLMISFVTVLNWLWYYFKSSAEGNERKVESEKIAREAELTMLRQQLQPHFLFNSLNSISALAGSQPERARHMIQQLSDFLRGTLRKDEGQLVTLDEEIKHLELYLDIEKVRFGHRLNTNIQTGELCRSKLIPHLLLQPLVENAIKFGLYDTTEAITIHIETSCTNDELQVSITNPFDPATAIPRQGTGFGLNSVKRRMYLLYARHDLVHTQMNETEKLFTTRIIIPQHDQSSVN